MSELLSASIPVIFESEDVIVLDKPGGLLSIEDGYHPELPNIRAMLKSRFGQIWTVHRLDKDTSGILLFAKNSEIHKFLNSQFSDRQVKKTYRAIVQGFPWWVAKTVDYPLNVNGDRKHRTVVDFVHGKTALTRLTIRGRSDSLSYLDVYPATGYTHQIRAHCSAVGLPILGDELYFRGCEISQQTGFDKLFLHACSLEISLRPNEIPKLFAAPLPKYFIDLEKQFAHLP